LNGALPDYGDALPRTVDACLIERSDVIDCRQVVRRKVMRIGGSGHLRRRRLFQARLRTKIVQAAEARHYIGERGGNGWLRGVRVVGFAIHAIAVDFRVEGVPDLLRGTAESDPGPASSYSLDREALRFEPVLDLRHVTRADAKTVRILFRREPAMIVRRRWILLAREQLLQLCLLTGRSFQHECDARHWKRTFDRAAIVSRCGLRRYTALQDNHPAVVNARSNALLLRIEGCER
jgi:hypothetical protein